MGGSVTWYRKDFRLPSTATAADTWLVRFESTRYTATAWLNGKPVLWTIAVTIALVGAVYFLAVQRHKPAHLEAPEGEVFAEETPPPTPAPAA